VQPAAASLGAPGIEIEAKSPYCPPGEDRGDQARRQQSSEEDENSCRNNPNVMASQIDYALVNTYTFAPKVRSDEGQVEGASGSVDFVNVVCAHGLDALRLTVGNGQNGGTIRGFNRLGRNPTETNTHAFGATAFWATDGTTTAVVHGSQITSNPDVTPQGQLGDRLRSGGFEIWMTGPIQNFVTHATHQGTFRCTTGQPALYQPIVLNPTAPPPDNMVAPPYFESILNLTPEPPGENS